MNIPKSKAFMYARKSQDRDDRQVLSIEGQITELNKLVSTNEFSPIRLPSEEQTAHKPGRPIFNDMMDRVDKREARYIVTWSTNRLARNPVDGGRLIWALQQGDLLAIVTPNRRYGANKEDLFLLTIEFGMAKMYSDEIQAGVLRGYKAKYERGEYPGYAPLGYINVKIGVHRNIAPDPVKGHLIKSLFIAAATGTYTLDTLHKYAQNQGLTGRRGNLLSKSTLFDLIKNRVYAGEFFHGGSFHIGSYEPLVTMDAWDAAQLGMGFKRASVRATMPPGAFPYKGIMRCGLCDCSITAEAKTKKLSNGATKTYIYYRCTRKNPHFVACNEPPITEEDLGNQLRDAVGTFVISKEACSGILVILEQYHQTMVSNRNTMLPVWEKDIADLDTKIDNLTRMRINDEIDEPSFRRHHTELSAKRVIAKRNLDISSSNAQEWLELAKELLSETLRLVDTYNIALPEEKRRILMSLGLNWRLESKKTVFEPRKPYSLLLNHRDDSLWRARPDLNRRSPP
jgi:site-specific DNA recombinase